MRPVRTILSTFAIAICLSVAAHADEPARVVPAPATDATTATGAQVAVLAGGCFWGLEAVFEHVRGVRSVRSGFAGGHHPAESVQIAYDPSVVSYGELLRVYFSVATDPTQLNRQGPDTGPEYRGVIFAANGEQERVARAYIAQLQAAQVFDQPIVTRVDTLGRFNVAPPPHQDFVVAHPTMPYVVINDAPKVANLQRLFPAMYTSARAP